MHVGHDAENIDDAELVVYTSAAQGRQPGARPRRERRGIPTIKRGRHGRAPDGGQEGHRVAGSHGKTTTTALIAFILHRCGVSPTFMVGGEMTNLGTNAEPGDGPHFVVEADEYDRAFLNYHPDIALVTNVEPDHLDIYGSLEKLQDAFRQFLSQVASSGYIVACEDSPALQACLPDGRHSFPRP